TADEDSANTSAARATGTAKRDVLRNPPAVSRAAIVPFITFLPFGLSESRRPSLFRGDHGERSRDLGAFGARHRLRPPAVLPFAEEPPHLRQHPIGEQFGVVGGQLLAHAAEL